MCINGHQSRGPPGMPAAFVDYRMRQAAFMHVSDLSVDAEPGDGRRCRRKTIRILMLVAPSAKRQADRTAAEARRPGTDAQI